MRIVERKITKHIGMIQSNLRPQQVRKTPQDLNTL